MADALWPPLAAFALVVLGVTAALSLPVWHRRPRPQTASLPLAAEARPAPGSGHDGHTHPLPAWQRTIYVTGAASALVSIAAFAVLAAQLASVITDVRAQQRDLQRVVADLEARDARQFCASSDAGVTASLAAGIVPDELLVGARRAVGCPRIPGETAPGPTGG